MGCMDDFFTRIELRLTVGDISLRREDRMYTSLEVFHTRTNEYERPYRIFFRE